MDKLNISVTRTIDSGVRPIELKCTPIYDCLFSNVAGLRSRALVNSVDYGALDPGTICLRWRTTGESASSFTARNLRVVLGALARPAIAGPRHLPISALVPRVSGEARDPGGRGDTAFTRGGPQVRRGGVPVLRSGAAAAMPPKDLQSALLHIRSLGCKVAVEGFGRADFPMSVLPLGGPGPAAAGAGP